MIPFRARRDSLTDAHGWICPVSKGWVSFWGLYDGIELPLTRAEGSPANSKTNTDNDIDRAVYVKTFFGNSSIGEIIAGADDFYL